MPRSHARRTRSRCCARTARRPVIGLECVASSRWYRRVEIPRDRRRRGSTRRARVRDPSASHRARLRVRPVAASGARGAFARAMGRISPRARVGAGERRAGVSMADTNCRLASEQVSRPRRTRDRDAIVTRISAETAPVARGSRGKNAERVAFCWRKSPMPTESRGGRARRDCHRAWAQVSFSAASARRNRWSSSDKSA